MELIEAYIEEQEKALAKIDRADRQTRKTGLSKSLISILLIIASYTMMTISVVPKTYEDGSKDFITISEVIRQERRKQTIEANRFRTRMLKHGRQSQFVEDRRIK